MRFIVSHFTPAPHYRSASLSVTLRTQFIAWSKLFQKLHFSLVSCCTVGLLQGKFTLHISNRNNNFFSELQLLLIKSLSELSIAPCFRGEFLFLDNTTSYSVYWYIMGQMKKYAKYWGKVRNWVEYRDMCLSHVLALTTPTTEISDTSMFWRLSHTMSTCLKFKYAGNV